MAINFPTGPSDGQVYTENGATYRYSTAVGGWQFVPFLLAAYSTANGAYDTANIANTIAVGNTIPATNVYNRIPARSQLNFVSGANIIIDVFDDSAGNRSNIKVTSTASGGGGSGYINVQDTAPTSPTSGQMWFNSANGLLLVYYNDGSSSQWVVPAAPTVANVINSNATILGNLYITGSISDKFGNIRDLPVNEQSGVTYTLRANDVGLVVQISANTTIPNAVFSMGQAITLVNNSSATQNIVNGVGVMVYTAGAATVGVRQLAQRGIATVLCTAANTFYISGAGLS